MTSPQWKICLSKLSKEATAIKPTAFLIRDFYIQLSYRFAFLFQSLSILMSAASFFFVSRVFQASASPYLAEYGGDYFAFVLIGLAFAGFLNTGMSSFSASISSAQAQGTLEAMLVTPTPVWQIVLYSSLWNFLYALANVLVYFLIGVLIFGVDVGRANLPAAASVLLLTLISFSGLGIISASVIMLLKRGDPLSWLINNASALVSGTFFPVAVLPLWLQKVAYFFPLFYALRAMRRAVLMGVGIGGLATDLSALAAFAVVILPVSLLTFRYAVRAAKIDGSLCTY